MLRRFFSSLTPVLYTLLLYPLSSKTVLAQAPQDWAQHDARCVGTGVNSDVATIQGLECLFFNVLQVIVFFAGLVFFVMFIVNGFNYLFSDNDQKKLAQVNASLTMTIAGLVGIIVSWLILLFIKNFTGFNVTFFKIGT